MSETPKNETGQRAFATGFFSWRTLLRSKALGAALVGLLAGLGLIALLVFYFSHSKIQRKPVDADPTAILDDQH